MHHRRRHLRRRYQRVGKTWAVWRRAWQIHIALHVLGCRSTKEMGVHVVLDDVEYSSDVCRARPQGRHSERWGSVQLIGGQHVERVGCI